MKGKKVIVSVICFFLFLFVLLRDIDVVSPGTGVITGAEDKVEILASDAGFINDFHLKTGDMIKVGDVLFSYTNLDSLYQERTVKELIDFADLRLKTLNDDQKLLSKILENVYDTEDTGSLYDENISKTQAAYRFINDFLNIKNSERNKMDRIEKLKEEKKNLEDRIILLRKKMALFISASSPEIEKINTEDEIKNIQTQITNNESAVLLLEGEIESDNNSFISAVLNQIQKNDEVITQLTRERLDNIGKHELLKHKIKTSSVVSPVDGIILSVEKNLESGSFIEHSQSVMTIKKSDTRKIIDAKFLARYRPFLYAGGSVKISINSPGFKKNIFGVIKKISPDSFDDENKHTSERYYKVEIEPKREESIPPELEGIPVNAYAISRKITLLDYITSTFNDNVVFSVW